MGQINDLIDMVETAYLMRPDNDNQFELNTIAVETAASRATGDTCYGEIPITDLFQEGN